MNKRFRSKNPDLLLPEFMDERIERITKITDSCGRCTGSIEELDRMTIFVTHRCNVFCEYCNGPHITLRKGDTIRKREMLRSDLSMDLFKRLLDEAQKHVEIKHIHFTGGEPTLNRSLPTFVEMATAQDILSSITTNGTASPEIYRDIINKGLTEIRISLDSYSGVGFDLSVGVPGSFQRVIKSIQEITKLRDEEGKDVFLVLNACVSKVNLVQIEKTLEFLISLDPDDIKFLVVAQDREFILDNKSKSLVNRLREALSSYPEDQFVLLRTKIENLFNPGAVGLQDQETQAIMEHCFVPITERTIDGSHYYPCSIYLRYYGEPIGQLTHSFQEQQAKITEFVQGHNCRQDPICSEHCTNCCKIFNVRTNQNLLAVDTGQIIKVQDDIAEQEIAETMLRIRALIDSGQPSDRPLLIIKPHGQQWRDQILVYLAENGFNVRSTARIRSWEECARFFYAWPLTKEKIRFTLEMDRAFHKIERGPADVLRFRNEPSPDSLTKIKLEIRKLFPSKRFQLDISGKKRWIRLAAVHTPKSSDVRRENAILSSLLKGND